MLSTMYVHFFGGNILDKQEIIRNWYPTFDYLFVSKTVKLRGLSISEWMLKDDEIDPAR